MQIIKKNDEIVTKDISQFGIREREIARELLSVYGTDKDLTTHLGDGVEVWFNKNSGYVFLSDEDYHTAMLNDNGELEDFLNCPNCGHEDLASEFVNSSSDECCKEYAQDMGLI